MDRIAAALQGAIAENGWTVTKLAVVAGVGEQTGRKWLKGETAPSGPRLELLRRALPGFAARLDSDRTAVA